MTCKKLLSLMLCIVMLMSAVTVGLTSFAGAKTVTSFSPILKLTFDGDAPYGMALHRGFTSYAYENGYLMMNNAANNGGVGFLAKNGTLGQNPFHANWQQASATEESLAAKENLLRLSAGKTYRLTFDFKYLEGTGGTSRTMSIIMADDPSMKYGTNDSSQGLADRAAIIEQTPATGAAGDAWKTASYTFTVNDTTANANGVSIGLHPGYSASYDTFVAVDNVIIEEAVGIAIEYNRIFHDMETETTADISKSGGTVEFVDSGDSEYGTVLKFDSTANARASFSDAGIIDKNKKYYVSFDAKADADDTAPQTVIGNPGGNNTYKRYFFTGYQTQDTGVTFYIDGQSVSAANFKISTKWQRFGLVIDTSNTTLLNSINSYQATFWDNTVYFLFGGVNCYFDNYELVEITDVPDAVPSLEKLPAEVSIRTPKAATTDTAYVSAGLRFKGTIPVSVKSAADEIGFVVAPSTWATTDSTWYDISSGVKSSAKAVACYNKSTGLNVIYSESAASIDYQLILTGLSTEDGKTAYIRRYSAVMYAKSGDSYTYYALGETSYSEVMALYNVTNADYTVEQTPDEPLVPDDSWKSHPQDFKLVALTFDDAPISGSASDTNVNMVKIVNTLNTYCGAGTFFVIGGKLDSYGSELLQYAVDNGFELGNHTQTHPSWSGCTEYANQTAQYYIDNEIAPVNEKIAAAVTDSDGNPYQMKFVRASNMYSCDSIIEACQQVNMPLVTGNQDKSGTFVTISEGTTGFIDAAVNNAYDGKILLMHCTNDQSSTELDTICEKLYAQGYRFCTLSELFEYKLGVTDMSTVDLEASIGGNSNQKGIFDVTQVELTSYREDQWYLHPEDYKLIAFTFDDGPVYTEKGDNAVTKVIDAFEAYYGRATFFFTGRSLNTYGSGIPEYALSKGHELANHSLNHSDLGSITDQATAIKEVSDVNDWYTDNMKYTAKWFRGGGYSENDYTWEYLTKIGMPSVGRVMGFSDYSAGSSTVESITNWFNTNTLENGSIIGMHSTNTSNVTADALAEVLPALYEQGYRFCTLSELCSLQGVDYEDVPTDKYIGQITVINGVATFN